MREGYTHTPVKNGTKFSKEIKIEEDASTASTASTATAAAAAPTTPATAAAAAAAAAAGTVAGTIISYEFRTRGHDIGFSVKFTPKTGGGAASGDVKEIVKYAKLAADKAIQSGTIEVKHAGIYTLEWDNSYSWYTTKDLLWRIDVMKPAAVADVAAGAHQNEPQSPATATAPVPVPTTEPTAAAK